MIRSAVRVFKRYIEHIAKLPELFYGGHLLRKFRKDQETTYIVCPFGIGDTLFVAMLIRAFKDHHNKKKVCLIVKENHRNLPDFFDSVDTKIVSNKAVKALALYARELNVFTSDNFRYGHFIQFGWPEPGQLLGVKNINLIDIYKACVLNIPNSARFEYPNVCVSQQEFITYKSEYGKYDKVVLLMPYAVTIQRLDLEFWEKLAQYYLENGCTVFTNVKDDSEQPIQGTLGVNLPLKELFVVSRNFKWKCIALRSGICDLLAFSDIELITIYENEISRAAWNMENLQLPNRCMKDFVLNGNVSIEENIEKLVNIECG